MNKKNYIKRTALPVALFFSMVTLVPALGFQPASAAIDKVQQQSAIKGIVVDEKGEPIIGANVVAEALLPVQLLILTVYSDSMCLPVRN